MGPFHGPRATEGGSLDPRLSALDPNEPGLHARCARKASHWMLVLTQTVLEEDLETPPRGTAVKILRVSAGDAGSIPVPRRSHVQLSPRVGPLGLVRLPHSGLPVVPTRAQKTEGPLCP